MKYIILCLLFLPVFIFCDNYKRTNHDAYTLSSYNYNKKCIEGHVYYQFSSASFSPKLNDNGTPVKCGAN